MLRQFASNEKYKKIAWSEKSRIMNVSERTLRRWRNIDMSPKMQKERQQSKGKKPKISESDANEILQILNQKRKNFEAVSLKDVQHIVKDTFHGLWEPCKETCRRFLNKNNWVCIKVQSRNPESEADDKEEKIRTFLDQIKQIIQTNNLEPGNVHIMDETGLYSNAVAPTTWTPKEDKAAYVKNSGSKRRDTLVVTLTGNGAGHVYFIQHEKAQYRKLPEGKIEIVQKGISGMSINEMKKWVESFSLYAKQGDLLIMDNLAAHKNNEVLEMLEAKGINVIFLPPYCADRLSVLDNCFFAVFKAYWYKSCDKKLTVDEKKDAAFKLFCDLVSTGVGKRMFDKCGYNQLFQT